ncbi:glycosyltransferase family 2 protein [bacterium]|nr:glycosyltransferase family 2 protein [bacterium]
MRETEKAHTAPTGQAVPDTISVVIPCRNEEAHIGELLESLRRQTWRGPLEVIVADGMSEDRTREIIGELAGAYPELNCRIIDNPDVNIPAGLNRGIAEARGNFIIRMDAHAVPASDYIERTMETLDRNADVAGGVCVTRPGSDSVIADIIAEAFSHPLGVGDSMFRLPDRVKTGREIDTVPFGSFTKSLWRELGGFNEAYVVHQDYEFNYRARMAGKRVYLNPAIVSYYYARSTLGAVRRQLGRYGGWKLRMLLRHPDSLKLRHTAPLLFILSLILLPLAALFWLPAIFLWVGEILLYITAGLAAVLSVSRRRGFSPRLLLLPGVFFVMHSAYALGMLRQLITAGAGKREP